MELPPNVYLSIVKSVLFLLALGAIYFFINRKTSGSSSDQTLKQTLSIAERIRISKEVELVKVQVDSEEYLLAVAGQSVCCLSQQPAGGFSAELKAESERNTERRGGKEWISIIPSGSLPYPD